jgi:glycerol uptake facilitator-like aquaporin
MNVLIGGAITGGSMNPARSLGPALFAGGRPLAVWWVYLLGPAAGAALAARVYELIRGGTEHAQGAPNELFEALREVSG